MLFKKIEMLAIYHFYNRMTI